MSFSFIFKEVARGKTLWRIMLANELDKLFTRHNWLNHTFTILELGSERASHQRYYPKSWRVTQSNYRQYPGTSLIIDANKRFPLKNGEYDGVVFFNLLFALINFENCISESIRVAKKFILFDAIFISPVTHDPNNYNRFTADRLEVILKKYKIRYEIIPVGNSFSSALSLVDFYLPFRLIRLVAYTTVLWLDQLDYQKHRECPTRYLVLITKNAYV